MSKQNVLITGANRGVGRGLVAAFLQKSNTTVIAAVRDPKNPSSASLSALPRGPGSRVIVITLDTADEGAAGCAIQALQTKCSIDFLDIVIANAGINQDGKPVLDTSVASIHRHFAVNTLGSVTLFQATAPLLRSSLSGRPVFVAISSNVGSIAGMDIMAGMSNTSPYGASKAALNWFMRRIHFDEDWLITMVLNPGFVKTDMVAETTKGLPFSPEDMGAITIEESAAGLVKRIDEATRDGAGGTFQNVDSEKIPW
ncbi:unnamed protein product [Clonostachys byssicola]|uniref:Uncharacterized protein n=1 Tax=Clonostachys byssicola TaxID=160290 RepID=A0A9N9UVQ6_9HYPO|nr:unnamed protein product [Clonostachys byssicola]